MAVDLTVTNMKAHMKQYISEAGLGMEQLLDQEVDNYIKGGGLAREVQKAIEESMPSVIKAATMKVMWDLREGLEEVIAEQIRKRLNDTA